MRIRTRGFSGAMPIPWKLEAPGADPVGGLLVHRDGDVLRSEMTMD